MSLDTAIVDDAVFTAFAEDATYLPGGINPAPVQVIFQDPDLELDTGEIEMEANQPWVLVLKSEVPSPTHADQFIVRGVTYQVDRVERDEATMLICHLEEI